MTLILQFVGSMEDSGEVAFVCLSNSLLHSKLKPEGRAFPGPGTWPKALNGGLGNNNGNQAWAAGTYRDFGRSGRGAC